MATVKVSVRGSSRDHRLGAATALLTLAHTQLGATVSDLERSEIALGELVDFAETHGSLTNLELDHTDTGVDLVLYFDTGNPIVEIPLGIRQVVDAGLDAWSVELPKISISLQHQTQSDVR